MALVIGCGASTHQELLRRPEPLARVAPKQEAPADPPRIVEEAVPREAAPEPPPPAPAITATVGYEKIRLRPLWSAPIIGLIRAGQSVALRDPNPLAGPLGKDPCPGGWYAVEPRGFVCLGESSTLARDDPRALAAAEVLPDRTAVAPFRVGQSLGAPTYRRIPTAAEQRAVEKNLDEHLAHLPGPDEAGNAVDPRPAGAPPSRAFLRYLAATKQPLLADEPAFAGKRVAWAREFDAEGRTWLLTPDLTLIPKDKVRAVKLPELSGVDLTDAPELSLPLAYLWLGDALKFERQTDGTFVETGASWPRHGFVPVSANTAKAKNGFFQQARDGSWMKSERATILRAQTNLPAGVGPNDKWISVKVTRGYMVAYEGKRPLFATAVSPGIDGIADAPHSTVRGTFSIGWKMTSADMSGEDAGTEWMVDEVPYVLYFKDHYALHGAWWHDEFGRPKSHGCVNLAPADSRFLFHWVDPVLPEGWYAVTAYYPGVKGTVVEIRK